MSLSTADIQHSVLLLDKTPVYLSKQFLLTPKTALPGIKTTQKTNLQQDSPPHSERTL